MCNAGQKNCSGQHLEIGSAPDIDLTDLFSHAASSPSGPLSEIVLYFDGHFCVAEIKRIPGWVVRGISYFDVLERIQSACCDCEGANTQCDPASIRKFLESSPSFTKRSESELPAIPRSRPIKDRLIEKYGKRSNRELAACIGIVDADAPTMLSSAMAGSGTRKVRCAIARALGVEPSSLWPNRPYQQARSDDELYNASFLP